MKYRTARENLNATILTILFIGGGVLLSTVSNKILNKNGEKAELKEGTVLSNDLTTINIDTNNDGKFSLRNGDIYFKIELDKLKRTELKKVLNIETGDKILIELSNRTDTEIEFSNIKAINNNQINENFISKRNKNIVKNKLYGEKERS